MWWILAAFVLGILGPVTVGFVITLIGLVALCGGNLATRAIEGRKQKALT